MTKIYYGPNGDTSDQYRLSPAPTISISTEFNYANDTIIGYTYNITLNGYISNYRKLTDEDDSATNPDINDKSIKKVIGGLEIVRSILSRNGSNLEIQDDDDNTIIKAKGGTLRSLDFNETENNWSTYATYSAQIEFNEIEFLGENIDCNNADVDSQTKSPNLVDIDNHKIKSLSEGWSFSIAETSFDYVRNIDTGSDLQIHNMVINASYNLSVTGKNYYIEDGLIPAHEQARIYAQKRLYNKVKDLVSGGSSNLFKISSAVDQNPCGFNNLNSIHQSGPGILGNISYMPYNENVSCDISESDGSFSVNYSCILKSNASGMSNSSNNIIHTINKTKNKSIESNNKTIHTINVNGTVQGLYPGGLVHSGGNFSLPETGSFILAGNSIANKYSSSEAFYTTIGTEVDIGDNLKNALGITYANLGITPCASTPPTPLPSSFNLTRNYIEGTITYSAEYNTNNCLKNDASIQSISFTIDNPVPVLAEFIIPNGEYCAGGMIIQDLKTFTARKINVSISGREKKTKECCNNLTQLLSDLSNCDAIPLPTGITLPDPDLYILTQKNRTDDRIQGTYNITLNYTCTSGCNI